MRANTFETLLAMIRQDPLTEVQMAKISGAQDDVLIDNAEAARICGVSEQVMRQLKVKRVRINRFLRYKRCDVLAFRDDNTRY